MENTADWVNGEPAPPAAGPTTSGAGRPTVTTALVAVLLLAGLTLRLILLDVDPTYEMWAGYVIDEGLWNELARDWVLFGQLELDPYRLIHTILAPLYQLATAVSFSVFGVGFKSARLVSALAGCGVLIVAVTLLRQRLTSAALAFVALALALQPDLLAFSRFAIPEVPALLFEFLAFLLIVSPKRSKSRALGAGVLTAIALGVKATSAPIVPLFVLVLIVADRASDMRSRLLRVGAFSAGVGVPAVVVLLAGALVVEGGPNLAPILENIAAFVRVDDLYTALTELFYKSFAPPLDLLLLPAWTIAGVLLAVRGRLKDADWSLYIGSAIWIVGWIGIAAVLAYFPERYVVHVMVPLSVNIAAGYTLLAGVGGRSIIESVAALGRVHRVVLGAWWSLPFAVLTAPIVLGTVAGPLQLEGDRFTVQVATITLCAAVLIVGLASREAFSSTAWLALVAAPLITAPMLMLAIETGAVDGFWALGTRDTAAKAGLLSLSAAIVAVASSRLGPSSRLRAGAWAYVAPIALLWIVQIAPTFLAPTYTIRDLSTKLGNLIDDATLVGSHNGGSLFLGNRVRYREVSPEAFASDAAPDIAVIFRPLSPPPMGSYETILVEVLELGDPFAPIDPRIWVYGLRKPDPERSAPQRPF